ncbi:hypothetical protein K466DRAFT_661831 [Polyporus arcularius HHB13444]|uniref:PH domain-containing protein n=1 Tax=Polyporus arcularius HHB13444 TaxID=1314778 RepID=A0A5C3PJ30_9APHY|nr:hypothetical protein K466DRAFT_661831 [Polyporus arcularius HHB13444]
MTRRSTATDESSPVHTPLDDLNLLQGPSSSRFAAQDGVRVHSPSSVAPSQSAFRTYREDDGGYTPAEDPSSYFANTPGDRDRAPQLSRRGTTKELIGRFEALDTSSAASTPKRLSVRRDSFSIRGGVGADKKDKARSPIRQSFRNLLSVFKKSKPPPPPQLALVAAREASPARTPQPEAQERALPPRPNLGSDNRDGRSTGLRPSHVPLTLQIPAPLSKQTQADRTICTSPISAHTGKTGPLLYLSRIPAANLPPVWMNCTGQLHSTHILITWETPQGNPSPKLVPFTACTDVRSLSAVDLDVSERGLLPDDPEWKVFELLFEGRARERFAANSLTERATWVSGLWDAILHAQETRVRSPAVSESAYTSSSMDEQSPAPTPSGEPGTGQTMPEPPQIQTPRPSRLDSALRAITEEPAPAPPASIRSSRISTTSTARELPPIPSDNAKPPALALDLRNLSASALAALPAPPTTPSSVRSAFLSPSRLDSPTRTLSPSIRNLDQRSMVKQRLAQIEGGSSRPQSPVSPTKLRQGNDSPLSLKRQATGASSLSTSILNSYLGSHVGSPVSERSTGLTTVASESGSPPSPSNPFRERNRASRFLALPKHDSAPASPISNYSAESEDTGAPGPQTDFAFQPPTIPLPPSSESVARPAEMRPVVTADDTVQPLLETIRQGVEGLQGRSATAATNIVSIRTKVDEVLEELRRRPDAGQDGEAPAPAVLEKLEALQTDIKGHLSELQATVEGLKGSTGGTPSRHTTGPPDLAALHEKLDQLGQRGQAGTTGEQDGQVAPTDLAEVMALLIDAEEQRANQLEHQTDSIRYLNELNTWLEAFVKHGTSQIEGVAAGVQQLCRDLGPLHGGEEAQGEGDAPLPGTNLLSDIRRLLVEGQARDQNTANLHASVNGLIAAVQDDMRHSAETRSMLTTESVIGVIDRQHQDQERMLKALATELTNEIRGERLRFVEAMKEATAINVQIHVEQFKKELTREVLHMTQDVTRLQRERQGLEQQIADLFAFYAKQKQSVKMSGAGHAPPLGQSMVHHPNMTAMPGGIPSTQSVYRRPLPSPGSATGPMRAQ